MLVSFLQRPRATTSLIIVEIDFPTGELVTGFAQ